MKRFLILFTMMMFTLSAEYGWITTPVTPSKKFYRGRLRISPDQKYIANVEILNRFNDPNISIYNIETGELIKDLDSIEGIYTSFCWSDNGKSLIYLKDPYNGLWEKYSLESDEITEFMTDVRNLAITPDGKDMVYTKRNNTNIYMKNFVSDTLDSLTVDDMDSPYYTFWSSNSKDYFYFINQKELDEEVYKEQLYSVDYNTKSVKKIVDSLYTSNNPGYPSIDLSIDACVVNGEERVIFSSNGDGNTIGYDQNDSLYYYSSTPDSVRVLFDAYDNDDDDSFYLPASIFTPKFSPDGNRIVFQAYLNYLDAGMLFSELLMYDIADDKKTVLVEHYDPYSFAFHSGPAFYDKNKIYFNSCKKAEYEDFNTEFQICKVEYGNSIEDENNVPDNHNLSNYPNPFNPTTTISYTLNEPSNINISVFNSKGEFIRELYNGYKADGNHSVKFDGSSLNSGIYYTVLKAGSKKSVKKMMMIK